MSTLANMVDVGLQNLQGALVLHHRMGMYGRAHWHIQWM
jgi:hypothetical protein